MSDAKARMREHDVPGWGYKRAVDAQQLETDTGNGLNLKAPTAAVQSTLSSSVSTSRRNHLGVPKIEAALNEASAGEPELIVIDLRSLTFIDSSGLQALVTGHELCQARGHELRIVPGPENVQRLFELPA